MMNDERYTAQVNKINALREALRKDPDNKKLAARIQAEEDKLYSEAMNISDDEHERYFRNYGIDTSDEEEY
jgi:hypothetical protein